MAQWHVGFMSDLYWLRIQRDKKEWNLEGINEGGEGAHWQRPDGVVDGVGSSRVWDVAATGGKSGKWLPAAAPWPGNQLPFLHAYRRHSGRLSSLKATIATP
jgi:hypothetical protein